MSTASSGLLITTPNAISLHSESSRRNLFSCKQDDGIVNARAAVDGSGLLAVADSHLVILYDANRGEDKQYELKNGDGEPRTLLFSPDSRTLYFTTTLSPSIQVYSIPNAELLSPLTPHISPPNVLSMSSTGEVLLAASSKPPMVFIHDLRFPGSAAINFVPAHTQSPVTCAAFEESSHEAAPPCNCVFAMGFKDGSLAIYSLSMPSLSASQGSYLTDLNFAPSVRFRQPTKIAAVVKLHKAAMRGVLAIAFLPGCSSRLISVGHDAKCRLLSISSGAIHILRTWRVAGRPTSLAVTLFLSTEREHRQSSVSYVGINKGKERRQSMQDGSGCCIAIGLQTGKVLVSNILGLPIEELDMAGVPVTGLQWVSNMDGRSVLPDRRTSTPLVELDQPVLDMLMRQYNEEFQELECEEEGTVKKTIPLPTGSRLPKPGFFGCANDLFASPPRRSSSRNCLAHQNSHTRFQDPADIAYSSPSMDERSAKRRKKSYPRPRIRTETFKVPPKASLPKVCELPASPIRMPTHDSVLLSQRPSKVEPLLVSGALPIPSPAASLSTENEVDTESETWVTPPTTQRARVASNSLVNSPRSPISPGFSSRKSSIKIQKQSVVGCRRQNESSRHVSFARRSSPKRPDRSVNSISAHGRPLHQDAILDGVSGIDSVRNGRRYASDTGGTSEEKKMERETLIAENEWLRAEIEGLKREFGELREVVLSGQLS